MSRAVGGYTIMEMTDWVDSAKATTRSAPITTLPEYASVYGYQYETVFDPTNYKRLLDNKKFQFTSNETLEPTDGLTYWSSLDKDKKAFFCSYAPYYEGSGTNPIQPTVYPNDATGKPGVTYIVPTAVTDQTDVLYASKEVAGDYKEAIPFEYKHALTAIQFKMGFACTVKSISIQNVNTQGTFTFDKAASGNVWEESNTLGSYTISFGDAGKSITAEGQTLTDGDNTLMLIPQSFASDATAKVELKYTDTEGNHTISASLANSTWGMGKKIVYTLYNTKQTLNAIYFDLAAGPVTINASTYSGKIYVGGTATTVSGNHNATNKYYVYQSTGGTSGTYSGANTGYESAEKAKSPENCRIPNYNEIICNGKSWGDYITNNTSLEDVSTNWETEAGKVNRTSTSNKVTVSGDNMTCDMTIDNLWIVNNARSNYGAIAVLPSNNSTATIRLKGDTRVSQLRYISPGGDAASISVITKTDKLILTSIKGDGVSDGTLTAGIYPDVNGGGNYWDAVIGGTDGSANSYGLTINGGTIYAAALQKENCTAIGGGGNGVGGVFINGGKVTAVTQGTAAAIGGGIGFSSYGGNARIDITGGEIYAYNLKHDQSDLRGVPAAAIGGGSSVYNTGNRETIINISGGKIYAESASGVGIGGGGSASTTGGPATINISGGNIIAKSIQGSQFGPGVAIGGGPSGTSGNGGTVTLNISGSPVIKTGSIGGGACGNSSGKVGSAKVTIEGSPIINGQFIMSKGASETPSFEMKGGTIQNSSTSDNTYKKVQENGGAVYIEDGSCTISGGTIKGCSAEKGGAVYVTGGSFTLSGGTLSNNHSSSDGGAVYVTGGTVTVAGGSITHNYTVNGNGGGVHVTGGGSFNMPPDGSGEITYNSANSTTTSTTGNGGGVYVASKVAGIGANILSGNVSHNTADHNGGGMYVEIGGTASTNVTIGVENQGSANPNISNNSAGYSGGALCVIGEKSKVTINSGKVRGNTSAYQKNQDIRNDGGLVELTSDNCDIDYKTITFHSNDGNNKTAVQRIVTNTNSVLAVPTDATKWTSEFGSISGWNTSKYGTGTTYTNGQTMNISNNMDLYAVWTANGAKGSSKFHK